MRTTTENRLQCIGHYTNQDHLDFLEVVYGESVALAERGYLPCGSVDELPVSKFEGRIK